MKIMNKQIQERKNNYKKLSKNDLHNLKRLMLLYTLEGSRSVNGVYYNKYKNYAKEKPNCQVIKEITL
jgi:hypothetical protein